MAVEPVLLPLRGMNMRRRLFRRADVPRGPWTSSLVLLTVFWGAAPLDAQTIRGRVLDAGTETGIPEAVVEVVREGEVTARATTDQEGRYEIRLGGRAPGTYLLRVSALGYPAQDSDPLVVAILEAVEVDLRISPSPIALEGIMVQVNRINLRHQTTYEGLYARRELAHPVGRERVVVRGDPEMVHATRMEDVLGHFFFREIALRSGGALRHGTNYTSRGSCVDWYLNGQPRTEEWVVDLPVDLIEGVEWYADGRIAPGGYVGGPCSMNPEVFRFSTVAVWTRRVER